ncbi:MAG TPA: thiamine pyrophosphate-dependent enzyme [Pseudomonadota bacterium]|jgi:pyruvate dehydrogenase E1 component alpha subunit/2-oxoisovalerate dehydrogenase E1 component alpha subunit|nr:thiamine pyrophosphate-dependent enzyme [Pseudomonadota bacterium]HNI58575.1 thiamine pyrophosphate-dependent enzyme [Pseudomonadota bacterium]HNK44215.1 thiamine pyrophosphate-dependent enzyme [Pseudomonadota bacterium]HNO68728.1 thiamine pyrophosphate-dependent enzyme [Pseudomonadota bacterium]
MRNAPPSFGFAPPAEQFVPRQYLAPNGSFDPTQVAALGIPRDQLLKLYRGMLLIRIIDERMLLLQRQGRISFYGEARGQEAAVVGTAAGLGPQDYILPALREAGAALYRGLPLRTYISQIYGNENDVTKGRQMPCHPGTRQARYVTMSSCIATQLPHAVGMAMAAKIRRDDVVIAGYMGDGATSEGDFHVALNFAAVYKAPVVFVCQNNQWAISTPVAGQTASPTMAHKALAYGIPALRVDGNDVLACYTAMRDAVAYARSGGGPMFVEALTYRVSAHSTSDDPSRYRDESVTAVWKTERDPIQRYRHFLRVIGALTDGVDEALHEAIEAEIKAAVLAEEAAGLPPLSTLIEDVFATPTNALREQLAEVAAALPHKPH